MSRLAYETLTGLYRQRAALESRLASVDRAIADVFAGKKEDSAPPQSEPRPVPVRAAYVPPEGPISDTAQRKAARALTKAGIR